MVIGLVMEMVTRSMMLLMMMMMMVMVMVMVMMWCVPANTF
jgi:hypothetical protein